MEGNHDHHHAAVVSENELSRRQRSTISLVPTNISVLPFLPGLVSGFLMILLVVTLSACRTTKSPEELSTDAGDFVGKVIYNSAGTQSNEQLSQGYGVDCTACGGLGYYTQMESDNPSTRQPCPSCQGKGWRTP
jgi:hypothetical protein